MAFLPLSGHVSRRRCVLGPPQRLFGLAYRMLGTPGDAEDVPHDAWLPWHARGSQALDDPEAWLVTVTTRIPLARAAPRPGAHHSGPWLQRLYLLLAWCEAVTRLDPIHDVPEEVYEQARAEFSEEQLIELDMAVVLTDSWNRIAIRSVADVGSHRRAKH